MLLCSTTFIFPMFGSSLAKHFGYSMVQLNHVAVAGSIGMFFAEPISGIVTDHIGSKRTIQLGAILMFIGYGGLSQLYADALPSHSYIIASVFFFFLGISGAIIGTAIIIAAYSSVSDTQRGKMVGLQLTLSSLSSALYLGIRSAMDAISGGKTSDAHYFIALAIITATAHGVSSLGILPMPVDTETADECKQYTHEVSEIAAYEDELSFVKKKRTQQSHVIADDLEHTPIALSSFIPSDQSANTMAFGSEKHAALPKNVQCQETGTRIVASYGSMDIDGNDHAALPLLSPAQRDSSLGALLCSRVFWGICCIRFLVEGAGIMYINNLGNISQILLLSKDPHADEQQLQHIAALQSTVYSSVGCIGAITAGLVNDKIRERSNNGSVRLFMGAILLQALCQIGIAFTSDPYVLLGVSVVTAIAENSSIGLFYVIIYDVWHGANYGRNR
ncbi:major facilitator superfamily domain-containing protein [Thamnocephalis sphaerospora]|uniref:Major facilitator superfamily domain-containing protein n=1 Tax=Thamnocephalis sphaerospora TaxID=78915 RepID=A0A4V1IXC2_9FUNG|nr:major facilitator superfamily domain-containing protein [Thamnocephalis sphaerospora]|eukprot:RKP10549.1 major facilitator superfamily domain-containing protein [Thamnocephalis sphaerospora]